MGPRRRSRTAFYLDNDIVHLEKAVQLFAAGLAGVGIATVAGILLGGFDSFLSILLPCVFLGWLLSIVVELRD